VIAGSRGVYWLRHDESHGRGRIDVTPLTPGVSMLTAYDLNDEASARIRRYLPQVRAAAVPDPERGDWSAWERLLGSREADANAEREGAMNVVTDFGFGTVSSVLLALPTSERYGVKPRLRFASGRPDQAEFRDVIL
jgi:hypothetical protein